MDGLVYLCLCAAVAIGHVGGASDRRFIVEGSNVIYDNHNVQTGQTLYVTTTINIDNTSRGCTFNGKHYNLAESTRGSDGCTLWACAASGMIHNSHLCPTHQANSLDQFRCNYQGVNYVYADTFLHANGCDRCVCSQKDILCTAKPECQGSPHECVVHGQHYMPGQQFDQGDGCNTCSCTTSGVQCTDYPCVVPQTTDKPAHRCFHQGHWYQHGDMYHPNQDCSVCVCTQEGFLCSDSLCTSSTTTTQTSTNAPCYINHIRIPDGQAILDVDGCNKCTCYDGYTECTSDAVCATTTQQPANHHHQQCHIDGHVYHEGDKIDPVPYSPCLYCSCHNGQKKCNMLCG